MTPSPRSATGIILLLCAKLGGHARGQLGDTTPEPDQNAMRASSTASKQTSLAESKSDLQRGNASFQDNHHAGGPTDATRKCAGATRTRQEPDVCSRCV